MPRLDALLVEKGLAQSRERAKEYIKNGEVFVNKKPCLKPSAEISDTDDIEFCGEKPKYVGRGGLKLEKAINEFSIDLSGLVCADLGASTGGFTDCMLQNGAEMVFAVDVGHGQLDKRLLNDTRVKNIEGVNFKDFNIDIIGDKCDFVAADLSFISVKFAQLAAVRILKTNGSAVFLIKPQFEAGRQHLSKNGIVKDKKVHQNILTEALAYLGDLGFNVNALTFSPITGGDGNIEYLVYAVKADAKKTFVCDVKKIVDNAFIQVKKGG